MIEFAEKNAEKGRDGRDEGSNEAMAMAMPKRKSCAYQRSIIVKRRKYFSFQIRNHLHTYIHTYLPKYIHTYIHTYVHTWVEAIPQTYVEFSLFGSVQFRVGQVPLGTRETLPRMSARFGAPCKYRFMVSFLLARDHEQLFHTFRGVWMLV